MKCAVCEKDAVCLLYVNWKGSKRFFGRCNKHIAKEKMNDKEFERYLKARILHNKKGCRFGCRKNILKRKGELCINCFAVDELNNILNRLKK